MTKSVLLKMCTCCNSMHVFTPLDDRVRYIKYDIKVKNIMGDFDVSYEPIPQKCGVTFRYNMQKGQTNPLKIICGAKMCQYREELTKQQ